MGNRLECRSTRGALPTRLNDARGQHKVGPPLVNQRAQSGLHGVEQLWPLARDLAGSDAGSQTHFQQASIAETLSLRFLTHLR